MEDIGLDLGKRTSHVCVYVAEDEYLERKLRTTREGLSAFFEGRPRCRVLIEASTSSEWVARVIESCGHEAIVADPSFGPMYAQRNKRIKTDKRDARALCDALRLGAFRRAHRRSDEQRRRASMLTVRETMVRARSKYISQIRQLLELEGHRPPKSTKETFAAKVRGMEELGGTMAVLSPLLEVLDELTKRIKKMDDELGRIAKNDEVAKRLRDMPGVGDIVSLAFISVVDDVGRFKSAKELRSYLGLVRREYSSSERQSRGRITKAGSSRVRALLVQGAWSLMRSKDERAEALREWTRAIMVRRGWGRAIIALARKMAGILFAMWRDGHHFEAKKLGPPTRRYVLKTAAQLA